MKYEEFEKQLVDTFNRMHYVEACDDGFMEFEQNCDVQHIIAVALCGEFEIKFDSTTGYTVHRDTLIRLHRADEDNFYPDMLQSFNDIMNKYHVVASTSTEYTLHII